MTAFRKRLNMHPKTATSRSLRCAGDRSAENDRAGGLCRLQRYRQGRCGWRSALNTKGKWSVTRLVEDRRRWLCEGHHRSAGDGQDLYPRANARRRSDRLRPGQILHHQCRVRHPGSRRTAKRVALSKPALRDAASKGSAGSPRMSASTGLVYSRAVYSGTPK